MADGVYCGSSLVSALSKSAHAHAVCSKYTLRIIYTRGLGFGVGEWVGVFVHVFNI